MRIGAEQSIGRCVAFPGAPTLRRDFSAACDALSPLFPIKPDSPSHHSASLVTPSPLRFVPVSGLGVCHLHGTSVPEKGRCLLYGFLPLSPTPFGPLFSVGSLRIPFAFLGFGVSFRFLLEWRIVLLFEL
ncbi:hypothetical protein C4D60_Mb09t16190 [Musa balbisiana]|uniref:Uncharacterized protein n=1 Tax=Musa balbisiana TaxID=52838 RepID=A0A4S8IGW7_MUSBA|nr:hypothetical protein C4D60_Mb09t16190 [Musa balbisiana]